MDLYDNGRAPAGVILDLDATLYPRSDYVAWVSAMVSAMLREQQGASTAEAGRVADRLRDTLAADWHGSSVSSFLGGIGVSREAWEAYRTEHFVPAQFVSLAPRVADSVACLSESLKVALLTNNTRHGALGLLAAIGVPADAFAVILCADDPGHKLKPHEQAFTTTAKSLGVHPAETVSVGDRYDTDVAPLVAAGGSGITVSGPEEVPSAVDRIVEWRRTRV